MDKSSNELNVPAFDKGFIEGLSGNWGSNPFKILTQDWRDWREGFSAGWVKCPTRVERALIDSTATFLNNRI